VASEAGVIGCEVGTAGLFEEVVERVVEEVIGDENEEVIDQVGGQRCSRLVVVGWVVEKHEYGAETMRY
jgi:hypothetical protein